MDNNPERNRHYLNEENVPLSEAVREAVAAHGNSETIRDESALDDHVNLEAIDDLFVDVDDISLSLQMDLPDVRVSVWSDGAVDIRVTDEMR